MPRRRGVQASVLVSLGIVVLGAVLVLTFVAAAHEEARLRALLGPALLSEARAPRPAAPSVVPGTVWWRFGPEGEARPRAPHAEAGALDPDSRALARRVAERGVPLLRPGAPWEPIRFAAPDRRGGGVVVGRVPAEASLRLRARPLAVIAGVALADVALFVVFGASVLRGRVVRPFQALAQGARSVAERGPWTRVAEEGPAEAAETARAFNEMTDALARRTEELEKAVQELRSANRELREARSGVDRAERLAAVGRLAAGVAHEVGNPIGALLAYLDLTKRDAGLSEEGRRHLDRATRQGTKVRSILQQLLDLARPSRPAEGRAELAALADEARALVAVQRRYARVAFEREGGEGAPSARAAPGLVSQILLNLLLNAGDAVREAAEPRVRITVRAATRVRRSGDAADAPPAPRPPDGVECVVADTGPGIPEADRERIFDPFFTTKPPGEGTGLGLASAARLAAELGGALELVEAPAPFRTAFRLRLPAADPPPVAPAVRGDGEGGAPPEGPHEAS